MPYGKIRREIICAFAVILLAGDVLANSQQPQQTGGSHHRNQQQQITATANDDSSDHQRGTEAMPLAVKITATPPDHPETEEQKRQRETKEANDKQLADATDAIGKYTFFLVVAAIISSFIGIGQLLLFFGQWKIMRKSLVDAKNTAQATRDSVDAQITAQRPWIDINIAPHLMRPHSEPADIINAARGLHREGFNYDGERAAIRFVAELTNVGLSAAFNVTVHCRLRVTASMAAWLESADLAAFIGDRFNATAPSNGPTILPNTQATFSEDVELEKSHIDKLVDEPAPLYHIDVVARYTYANCIGETVASFIVTHTKAENATGLFYIFEPEIPSDELRFDKIWALGYST